MGIHRSNIIAWAKNRTNCPMPAGIPHHPRFPFSPPGARAVFNGQSSPNIIHMTQNKMKPKTARRINVMFIVVVVCVCRFRRRSAALDIDRRTGKKLLRHRISKTVEQTQIFPINTQCCELFQIVYHKTHFFWPRSHSVGVDFV